MQLPASITKSVGPIAKLSRQAHKIYQTITYVKAIIKRACTIATSPTEIFRHAAPERLSAPAEYPRRATCLTFSSI